jgi:hypothetical protein
VTLPQVLNVMVLGILAYFTLDMARTIKRQRDRIHQLRQALFDIYHTMEVPQSVREQALIAIKKGGQS